MTNPVIELTQYTDPYCTWCWGAEPMLRKIEEVYGDQIRFKYVMGGLVRDMREFQDRANNIGGKNWYSDVAAHWLEASDRHGMPVDEKIFFDIKNEIFSTYPASIAFKAAQLQGEQLANKYLRRLREAASAERQIIQHLDVQARLAEEVGLNATQLIADIEGGVALQAFEADLKVCRLAGVSGFPTFAVQLISTGKRYMVGGFRGFREVNAILRNIAGDLLVESSVAATDENILAFVAKHGKVAPRELAEVFDLNQQECIRRIDVLEAAARVRTHKVGNGFFVTV